MGGLDKKGLGHKVSLEHVSRARHRGAGFECKGLGYTEGALRTSGARLCEGVGLHKGVGLEREGRGYTKGWA